MQKIEQIMDWLKRQKFWKAFLLMYGLIMAWKILICSIYTLLGLEFSQNVYRSNPVGSNSLFDQILLAPFEEVIFRWIPMLLLSFVLMWLYKTSRISKEHFFKVEKYAILILAIISSIVFGWVHGNYLNIFLQGVMGLLIMLFYLRIFFIRRDKGLRNRWQVISLAEAMLLHAATNII